MTLRQTEGKRVSLLESDGHRKFYFSSDWERRYQNV